MPYYFSKRQHLAQYTPTKVIDSEVIARNVSIGLSAYAALVSLGYTETEAASGAYINNIDEYVSNTRPVFRFRLAANEELWLSTPIANGVDVDILVSASAN